MKPYQTIPVDELPVGTIKSVEVNNRRLLLANIGGEICATDDACTHAGCSLGANGFPDGQTIICGCHGAVFDIPSGKVKTLPATVNLKTYKVKLNSGYIWVSL